MTTARALPPEPLAPWTEIVPGTGPTTVARLLDLPDDDGYREDVVPGFTYPVARLFA